MLTIEVHCTVLYSKFLFQIVELTDYLRWKKNKPACSSHIVPLIKLWLSTCYRIIVQMTACFDPILSTIVWLCFPRYPRVFNMDSF